MRNSFQSSYMTIDMREQRERNSKLKESVYKYINLVDLSISNEMFAIDSLRECL